MTIKKKLSVLVMFIPLALFIVGITGNSGISTTADALHEVTSNRLPSLVGLQTMNEAQTAIRMRTIETAIWENDYKAQGNFSDVLKKKREAWERAEKGWKIYEP